MRKAALPTDDRVQFTKLPHAGMLVEDSSTGLMFDPILGEKTVQSTYLVTPAVVTTPELAATVRIDAVFISHEHEDHFNIESLDLLSRELTIYFPEGAVLLGLILRKLGFKHIAPLRLGQAIRVGHFTVTPTPSRVPFPEVGFIVTKGSVSIWNLVDTLPDQQQLQELLDGHGRPTLLLPYHQPTQELKVANAQIIERFPKQELAKHVARVVQLRPRWVLPSSYDLFNYQSPWLNSYLAPITRQEFIAEVRRLRPEVQGLELEVGSSIIFEPATDEFRRVTELRTWPAQMINHDTTAFYSEEARDSDAEVMTAALNYLKHEFIAMARAPLHQKKLANFRRCHYTWTLQLTLPRGADLYLSFDFQTLRWSKTKAPQGAVSAVAPEVLVDYFRAKISTYALLSGGLLHFNDAIAREPLTSFASSYVTAERLRERMRLLGFNWNSGGLNR